jgi:hypothetical protein
LLILFKKATDCQGNYDQFHLSQEKKLEFLEKSYGIETAINNLVINSFDKLKFKINKK